MRSAIRDVSALSLVKSLLVVPALIAGLGLMSVGRVGAQTFTTLHGFDDANGRGNGWYPQACLVLSGTTLYGTAPESHGGTLGYGLVFAVHTDGSGFTNVCNFYLADSVGLFPTGGLILSGNTLYGTAVSSAWSGSGSVFAVNTDGTVPIGLHIFSAPDSLGHNNDGRWPRAGLVLSGNTLYGTTQAGGSSGNGTVFAVNTDGTG